MLAIAVLRIVIVFAVLAAIYIALSAYMRWERRKTLRDEYMAGAAPSLTMEDYIAKGLAAYERSWERKALYGIFLLPAVVGLILIILAEIR